MESPLHILYYTVTTTTAIRNKSNVLLVSVYGIIKNELLKVCEMNHTIRECTSAEAIRQGIKKYPPLNFNIADPFNLKQL